VTRADPAVSVSKLGKRFGDVVALDDVTFDVKAGELFGLIGPDGAGKTTLFRILATLIEPTSGVAEVLGLDVVRQRDEVRRGLGVVFQSPSLDKQLTAEENLRHHGHLYGLRGAALRERIRDLLGRVNLLDRARERVSTFSGGMRRRVEVAKGMLHQPQLLLLDEPSTGLDPVARGEVWDVLTEARGRAGVTVLLTTHLMDEADRCDRVAIMDAGKLIALDTPAALKERVGGDVITLKTRDARDAAAVRALVKAKLNVDVDASDDDATTVRFERQRGHEFVPALIEALPGLVDAVSVGKPTLEDVFIRLTGKRLHDQRDVTTAT
jgi:ABC-2 type transport system ATP-binding protein